MVNSVLSAPFPYFGGKSRAAHLVWERFGDVRNYVEPFAGTVAVLLARPQPFAGSETINDLDGFVANFWRAVRADPQAVAAAADWPVNENDLHARHAWLIGRRDSMVSRLEGDPDWYDAKVAGWWVWGQCCWIGSGWCSGRGPWQSVEGDDGVRELLRIGDAGVGAKRSRVDLGGAGRGVNRTRVHLGDAGRGVNRKLVHLGDAGKGVNRKLVHLGNAGQPESGLYDWFAALSDRLRRVRVCCGDWSRLTSPTATTKHGLVGVFLDPPYADTASRDPSLYSKDSQTVAHGVREWAVSRGDDPKMRIALCGYEGEHVMPPDWTAVPWKSHGGMGNQGKTPNLNRHRERIWFSPHCLRVPVAEPVLRPRKAAACAG